MLRILWVTFLLAGLLFSCGNPFSSTPEPSLTIIGQSGDSYLGSSVTVSGDGSTMALPTTVNTLKEYTGKTFADPGILVFRKDAAGAWKTLGEPILEDHSHTISTIFGSDLSFSHDGTVLSVGSRKSGKGRFFGEGKRGGGHHATYVLQGENWKPLGQEITPETLFSVTGEIFSAFFSRGSRINATGDVLFISMYGKYRGFVFRLVKGKWVPSAPPITATDVHKFNQEPVMNKAGTQIAYCSTSLKQGDPFPVKILSIQKGAWVNTLADIPLSVNLPGSSLAKRDVTFTLDESFTTMVVNFSPRKPELACTAFTYVRNGGDWMPEATTVKTPYTGLSTDCPRVQLSADGKTLLVANTQDDDERGIVEYYQRAPTGWNAVHIFSGEHSGNTFQYSKGSKAGSGFSLSADGKIIVIGSGGYSELHRTAGRADVYSL